MLQVRLASAARGNWRPQEQTHAALHALQRRRFSAPAPPGRHAGRVAGDDGAAAHGFLSAGQGFRRGHRRLGLHEKLRSLLVDTLTETSKKVETTSKGGTFQPLSWWAQAGYDVEAVQEHGEREEHEARLAYQSRYLSRHVVRLQMFPSFSSLLRCSGKSSGWS